ncbi:MAG: YihY/virulence factor BrkB family protein, partial [Pseudomonadota bacterium]
GIIKLILDRLISLGIILSLGFIMIASLVIDSSIVLLQNWLVNRFPDIAVFFIGILQYVLLALLGTIEIYALLNFLPDVHLPRRYKVRGCAFIALLLIFGKSTISWYIGNSRIGELGGASASVLVLMLWIYYSSMIVFFGTELIKSMGVLDNVVLQPKRYAVRVKSVQLQDEPVIPPAATAAEGEQADKEAEQAVEIAAEKAACDRKEGVEPELPARPDNSPVNTAVDPNATPAAGCTTEKDAMTKAVAESEAAVAEAKVPEEKPEAAADPSARPLPPGAVSR